MARIVRMFWWSCILRMVLFCQIKGSNNRSNACLDMDSGSVQDPFWILLPDMENHQTTSV